MLLELDIENYAVVDKLRVGFGPGLNLLTGETGSGKSIVVDALALLLGARATTDVIRGSAERARVTGVFDPGDSEALEALLEEAGFEPEAELIVERQVLSSGKSRAYLNGRPTTVAVLKLLAAFLGDIHGQHEQQSLFSTRTQLEMLDAFAKTSAERETVAALYSEQRALREKLAALRGDEQERLRLLDLYRFQANEIQAAGLAPGEDDELEADRNKLRNLAKLQQAAGTAYDALYDSAVSASVQLKAATKALEELAEFESRFGESAKALAESRAVVDDVARDLGSYVDDLEANPGRLDQIEERLAEIEKLERKYGKTLAEVIAYGEEAAGKAAELEGAEHNAAEVEKRLAEAGAKYLDAAGKLSAKRRNSATKLAKAVEAELGSLAMTKASFAVDFSGGEEPEHWAAHGFDGLEFHFSANPGQPPRPLAQVASGGELSRITLAIKTCLAPAGRAGETPRTLVFDEIDTGVGGRVADAIGRRLKKLSAANQVLCVTHLPQIAGFADSHYRVEKAAKGKETFATLAKLEGEARTEELARMLSGEKVTEAALQNARELLAAAR